MIINNFLSSSGDVYLSLGISLSFLFVIVSELFCYKFLETFVILSAINDYQLDLLFF